MRAHHVVADRHAEHASPFPQQHSFASTAQRGIDRARQYRELCAARNQRKFDAHILHYSTANEPPCLQSAISVVASR
jgi:hypothetical protein